MWRKPGWESHHFSPVLEWKNLSKPFWLRQNQIDFPKVSSGRHCSCTWSSRQTHVDLQLPNSYPQIFQGIWVSNSNGCHSLELTFGWLPGHIPLQKFLGNKTKVGCLSLVSPFVRSESPNLWNQPKSFTVCDMSFDINQHPLLEHKVTSVTCLDSYCKGNPTK